VLYNIFEVGNLLDTKQVNRLTNKTVDYKEYDDMRILLENDSNQLLNIKKYVDNPFLPKSIANKLILFYFTSHETVNRTNLEGSAFVVKTSIFEDGKHLKRENISDSDLLLGKVYENSGFASATWLNLKTNARKLTKEVDEWFKKHGINDVNLRTDDYKNLT
jgi:hypothetical protein